MGHGQQGRTRPKDWDPLAESDPTPGDVEGVRDGKDQMKETGKTLRDQVKRLNAIKEADGLKGQYVDQLQEGSEKLADRLEKSAGRYERVSTQLKDWSNDLEHAQSETAKALSSAKTAAHTIRELVGTIDEDSNEAKKKEDKLEGKQKSDLEDARTALTNAKSRYHKAVEGYHEDAARRAKNIRGIIDDAVEDSWWSGFSNWVEDHADTIKTFIEVAAWIATIAAVIAVVITLCCTGAGILALAGFLTKLGTVITFGSVIADGYLASTGNGGWGQVAFDVLGLVTFGAGRLAIRGASKGAQATRAASIKAARQQSKNVKSNPNMQTKLKALESQKSQAKSKQAWNKIQRQKEALVKSQKPRGVRMEPAQPSRSEIFRAGGHSGIAKSRKFAEGELAKRGDDPATVAAVQKTRIHANTSMAAFATGTGMDVSNKMVSGSLLWEGKPKVDPWVDAKGWNPDRSGMVGD